MNPVEPIYAALFALASTGEGALGSFTWSGGGPFAYTSRRVRSFDDLTGKTPALCQAEHDENIHWKTNQEAVVTLNASWLIYHQAGKNDPTVVPATTTNAIIDAVKQRFEDPGPDGVLRLAGTYRCWIEGRIQKFQGDLDGDTLIVVPIKILVT
jgi:hypothetical protein